MPGRKVWAPGEQLNAADVNEYLMRQAVMVFASASARDAAIGTAVAEGMHAYVGGGTVTYYDGSTWQGLR